MPNTATVSVIITTKDVVKRMSQGIAAYQYEPDCFQNITYKYFLNANETYRQDFKVNDFVQFTGRLVYENETLYMTVINSTLLRDRTLDTHLSDNALPLSTPVITITVTLASPAKKLSNVRFFKATYNEYNAVTSTKKVEQTVNVLIREEDTRLINATNKLTNDRPFLISGYLTIGEDKMILLELLDIDILYHLTAPPSKHPLQSPSSVKSTTSRFTTIVQEIKKQLPPPSPTSPINHQTTPTPIPMVQMAQTLTPTTLLPSSSAASITSPPDAMADTDFSRFYAFYRTFQEHANKDNNNILASSASSTSGESVIQTTPITGNKRTKSPSPTTTTKRRQTRSQTVSPSQIPAKLLSETTPHS